MLVNAGFIECWSCAPLWPKHFFNECWSCAFSQLVEVNLLLFQNQFIECWSHVVLSVGHVRLSLAFSSFFLSQRPRHQWLDGIHPAPNVNIDQADRTVCPQIEHCIECWSYALLSVGLVRLFLMLSRQICCYFRVLGDNWITGTIPEVISTLVKLTRLYAPTSFY